MTSPVEEGRAWSQASWNLPEEEWHATKFPDALSGEIRANFVRKVYGILAAQMAVTVTICAAAMFVPVLRIAFLRLMAAPWANLAIFIPALCVLCALQAKKAEHPTNYQLLFAFTILMSLSIAGICAVYQKMGAGALILEAALITMAAFGSLSLYAIKSGKDFSWMGGMLTMGLVGMIMFGLMGSLFGFSGGAIFSLFGAILFSGFILYDTSRILTVYGPDDAIVASVELYLDILNLFLYILELLSRCQEQQD
jgi:FtsH-binding integral membrane protein